MSAVDDMVLQASCAVCLGSFASMAVNTPAVRLRCTHVYCAGCIQKWWMLNDANSNRSTTVAARGLQHRKVYGDWFINEYMLTRW